MEQALKTGDLAKATGKTVRAIHYYEELGLIKPLERSRGGFRHFRHEDIERIDEISRLQEAGLSLEEISDIVKAWRRSPRGIEVSRALRDLLERSIEQAKSRVTKLNLLKEEIEESLAFLHTCGTCEDRPERHACGECVKGDHQARLPRFIERLMD